MTTRVSKVSRLDARGTRYVSSVPSPKNDEAMDRARRVAALWNWLPAFRVVGEYESIHKASLVLRVSPSSLSRTIKLIEDVVGSSLFVRSSTGLTLTSFGAHLLKGTRDAMRRVDDALEIGGANRLRGDTLVAGAAGSVLARLLGVAAASIRKDEGPIRLRLTALSEERVVDELLRGNVDVALIESTAIPELPEELIHETLGELEFALYAPSGLATRPPVGDAEAPAQVVVIAGTETDGDGVVATVASLDVAEIIAAAGPFLALLPTALARPPFLLMGPVSARVAVVAVHRKSLGGRDASHVEALIASVRDVLKARAAAL